jgi:superoxide dismutase, Cu-Zn family
MKPCDCISINGTFIVLGRYRASTSNNFQRGISMRSAVLILMMGLTSVAAVAADKSGKNAMAMLQKADGTSAGMASFTSRPGGVWMKVEVKGLAPGTHGIHLHAVGTCTAPDFASAGGHWNPMHKMHGLKSPQGAHMGDLPNLVVKADGSGKVETMIKGATLDSGETGLFDSDGTALVIHAGPDDNVTDPSGNSGGRIACGAVTES